MVDGARRQGARSIEEYRKTVERSAGVFSPLGEPLTALDFAGHRWVAGHREEAYSDWLQWIMARADGGEVLRVFGIAGDKIALLDYSDPDKLQKAQFTDGILLGVKLKVSDQFEAAIYRYWVVEERATGIEAWVWIKERAKLARLGKALHDACSLPEPKKAWGSCTSGTGTYFLAWEFEESEIGDMDLRLNEFITHLICRVTKAGGVKRFLGADPK